VGIGIEIGTILKHRFDCNFFENGLVVRLAIISDALSLPPQRFAAPAAAVAERGMAGFISG
jgi:hypothetical protein